MLEDLKINIYFSIENNNKDARITKKIFYLILDFAHSKRKNYTLYPIFNYFVSLVQIMAQYSIFIEIIKNYM